MAGSGERVVFSLFILLTCGTSNNNNNDFINVSSKNLAEGIPHC